MGLLAGNVSCTCRICAITYLKRCDGDVLMAAHMILSGSGYPDSVLELCHAPNPKSRLTPHLSMGGMWNEYSCRSEIHHDRCRKL